MTLFLANLSSSEYALVEYFSKRNATKIIKMAIMASAIRKNMLDELPNARCCDISLHPSQDKTMTNSP
jgi:hypothetical protein